MELYNSRQERRGNEATEVNECENKTYVMLYDTMMVWNLNEEVGNSCVVKRRSSKSHGTTKNISG